MKKYINTFIFLVCAFSAFAQAPQKFNYQAVARNAQGTVLSNQNVKIRASILDGSANGTSQYSETHSATTSQLGLFNLAIGGGTLVSGNFTNITWSNGDKYLKIEMDATGGNNFSLVGTSQLLSVPYALNAGNGSQWVEADSTNGQIFGGILYSSPWDTKCYTNGHQLILDAKDNPGFGAVLNLRGGGSENYWNFIAGNSNSQDLFAIRYSTTNPFTETPVLSINSEGNFFVGEGYNEAASKLQVKGGDIYIQDVSSGVIMKSPNGGCWRLTVSDSGQPVFANITCPQ